MMNKFLWNVPYQYIDKFIGILVEFWQASDEDRVLTHWNDHKSFQEVPWKHYTDDMVCLDKAILF